MNSKENKSKINYRIKFLADKSLVLVEANDYESEVFTPQIVNGRITLLNVIPNRRSCQDKTATKSYTINGSQEYPKKENKFVSAKRSLCTPLANSTPNCTQRQKSYGCMLYNANSYKNSSDSNLPTPEPVRRALTQRNAILDKPGFNIPKEVYISPRSYMTEVRAPKRLGCPGIVGDSFEKIRTSTNTSVLNSNFSIQCSPSQRIRSANQRFTIGSGLPAYSDSIERWHKVLTPMRTYTRKSATPIMVLRPVDTRDSCKKSARKSKYSPTYLVNPTQGVNGIAKIELKRRKLILDSKVTISPKSFKKQQEEQISNIENFPLPEPYIESLKMSAFDMLTNSNRARVISKKLNHLFRKGCVNKASSTYYKYKVLSTVPPLLQDEQILELSRIDDA